MGKDGRFDVSVTFDERRGYVGTHPELRAPVTALSLGGLRRKVEAAMLPEEVIVMLSLDKAARLERDRRRLTGRTSPGRRPGQGSKQQMRNKPSPADIDLAINQAKHGGWIDPTDEPAAMRALCLILALVGFAPQTRAQPLPADQACSEIVKTLDRITGHRDSNQEAVRRGFIACRLFPTRSSPPPSGNVMDEIEPNPRGITRSEVEQAVAEWCQTHMDAPLCKKLERDR